MKKNLPSEREYLMKTRNGFREGRKPDYAIVESLLDQGADPNYLKKYHKNYESPLSVLLDIRMPGLTAKN